MVQVIEVLDQSSGQQTGEQTASAAPQNGTTGPAGLWMCPVKEAELRWRPRLELSRMRARLC